MNDQLIHFIVVDDHQLFADGLVRILQDEGDFQLTSICKNGDELFMHLEKSVTQLIFLDIQLQGASGLEICTEVKEKFPDIKIILISMIQGPHVIKDGMHRGANGYIPKTTDAALLKEVIRKVLEGENIFLGLENTPVDQPKSDYHKIDTLSPRELEIIGLVKKGMSTKAIAEQLFLSEYTVDTHRKNILRKLQLSSASELIAYAFANHL